MSIASWKKQFYPITAKAAAKQGDLEAAEHSLQKWEGVAAKHLAAHGLEKVGSRLQGGGSFFYFDGKTCSLCERFYDAAVDVENYTGCRTCPLAQTLKRPCTWMNEDGSDSFGPYEQWVEDGDPQPMIAALRKTVRRLRRQRKPTS